MKKALMGTTALVAAAVTTGVAVAEEMMAEPISISVGGRSMWGVAIVDSDAANKDDVAISNDVLLVFKGSTVLDSGLEVGMRIDIEGEEGDDSGDGKYAYVSGSFGEIRVGNEDAASYKMSTAAPYATYFYGINTPFWAGSLSGEWHSTFAGVNLGASASVLYFSPVINGFQFGVSYTPEAGTEARSNTVYSDEGNDAYSVGLRYDGAVGDAGVTVAAGYTSQDVAAVEAADATGLFVDDTSGVDGVGEAAVLAAPGRTETDWNAGLVVSMAGVSVGGSYRSNDPDMVGVDDEVQYDIGAKYGEGPWAISVNFGNKSQDSVDTDFSRLMATYNVGPGVNLAGVLGRDSPSGNDDTSFGAVAFLVEF